MGDAIAKAKALKKLLIN
jgi:hypothetical protein